jgi:hypothetical protein
MKNNRNRKLLLFGILVTAASLVLANTPAVKKWWTQKAVTEPPVQKGKKKKDPVQLALTQELSAWLKPFDSTNTSYYFDALLTAVDRTDSAHAMIDVQYSFCKNGSEYYLRSGQKETINTNKLHLFIDHDAQKMILGEGRQVQQAPGVQVNAMYDFLQEESYTLSKKAENGRTIITMANPTHISCKEFTVDYDSTVSQVKRIFFRQAEVTDHMNPDKEKWVTLNFKNWNDDPDASKYLKPEKFVVRHGDQWACTAAFSAYELIVR